MGLQIDWRCAQCGQLLGRIDGQRLHVRFSRAHEYLCGFPVIATCRRCQTLNATHGSREDRQLVAAHTDSTS